MISAANEMMQKLKSFALDDKFINAELPLALFELTGKRITENELNDEISGVFWPWFLLIRNNGHYSQTPIQTAQKYQPENFAPTALAVAETFKQVTEKNRISATSTGLVYEYSSRLMPGQVAAGIFILDEKTAYGTTATTQIPESEIDLYKERMQEPVKLRDLFSLNELISSLVESNDIIDLEDRLKDILSVFSVEDITEMDISDRLEELEHPDTIISDIRNQSQQFADSSISYLQSIMSAIQNILDVDLDSVKKIEISDSKTGKATEESEMDVLFDQMSDQFQTPEQKSFYGDFFTFIKEQKAGVEGQSQQQAMQNMAKLEKVWRNTKRDNLDGLTPDEYKEQNPDVELATQKTVRREEPKVGRNDPCPCGSGKKYKKCHGKNV